MASDEKLPCVVDNDDDDDDEQIDDREFSTHRGSPCPALRSKFSAMLLFKLFMGWACSHTLPF